MLRYDQPLPASSRSSWVCEVAHPSRRPRVLDARLRGQVFAEPLIEVAREAAGLPETIRDKGPSRATTARSDEQIAVMNVVRHVRASLSLLAGTCLQPPRWSTRASS